MTFDDLEWEQGMSKGSRGLGLPRTMLQSCKREAKKGNLINNEVGRRALNSAFLLFLE